MVLQDRENLISLARKALFMTVSISPEQATRLAVRYAAFKETHTDSRDMPMMASLLHRIQTECDTAIVSYSLLESFANRSEVWSI